LFEPFAILSDAGAFIVTAIGRDDEIPLSSTDFF